MDNQKFYDSMVAVLLTNLIPYNNVISLGNFDPKNENHLCIFCVACIKRDLYHCKLAICLNWFDMLIFKFKHKCWKTVQRTRTPVIDCKELIKKIEEANNYPEILCKIYREYYNNKEYNDIVYRRGNK